MKKQSKKILGAVLIFSMVSIPGMNWSLGAGRNAGAGGGSGFGAGAGTGGASWGQAGGDMNSIQAQSREFMGLGSADYQRQQTNAKKAGKMAGPQDGSGGKRQENEGEQWREEAAQAEDQPEDPAGSIA